MKASSNWFFAAGSYVGFCMLWLAGFMTSLGASNENKKEAVLGAVFGAAGFSLALIVVTLGIMANIEQLAGTMVPLLVLAGNISPAIALIFSFIVVFIGLKVPFDRLVNIIYVINGYVGIILLGFMLIKTIAKKGDNSCNTELGL